MSLNLQSIIEAWTRFDMKKVQHDLDDKVIEIAQKLEEGDSSRKALVERTKEFRKSLTDEQRKLVGPLLKQFQQEVDGSTKRSKFMEQVLLGLYKQLIDLPDPGPALENAEVKFKKAEKMTDLEIENKQLKSTLDEYHEEFAQVKNQEVTIKALKDKIKEIEATNEQQVAQRLKEKEKELQRSYAEKEEQLRTTQLDLVTKLGDTENKNLAYKLQMEKCQSEMYDMKQKQDELLNARASEMDILMQDLDKLTERAVSAERLVEQYQKSLETSNQEMASIKSDELNKQQIDDIKLSNLRASSLEVELVAKDKEISQLVEDIQKLHMKSNKSREFYESQRGQLEEKLAAREKAVEGLEAELDAKKDYEEIKHELSVLKMIEFNLDGNSAGGEARKAGEGSGLSAEQPLELMLLEKNRQLMNENTQVKNRLSDINRQFDLMTRENSDLKNTNENLQKLVVELEKDLHKLARNSNGHDANQSSQSTVLNLESKEETSEHSISMQVLGESTKPGDSVANSLQESAGGEKPDLSLFNIVSNQRERFKTKCQELEVESMASKQQVVFLTNELDQLRSDNVKLYEKIRYLQSAGGSYKPKNNKFKQSDYEYDGDNDEETVLNKYSSAYESRLDPFSKFSYREKQRRYANLKLHDKFTLNFGRFILSNSLSRMIFCGYFLILHLLMFFNLYHMAHHTAAKIDMSAECAHAYKNHMAEVHGNKDFHLH